MVLAHDRSIPTRNHAVTNYNIYTTNSDNDNDDNNYDCDDNSDYLLGLRIKCLMVRGAFGK